VRRFGVHWIASERQEVESKEPTRTTPHLAGKPKEENSMVLKQTSLKVCRVVWSASPVRKKSQKRDRGETWIG
jgi:hypothetical protein